MPDPMTPTPTDAAARIADAIDAKFEVVTFHHGDYDIQDVETVAAVIRTALAAECEGLATAVTTLLLDYGVRCGASEHDAIADVIRAHLCGPAK